MVMLVRGCTSAIVRAMACWMAAAGRWGARYWDSLEPKASRKSCIQQDWW